MGIWLVPNGIVRNICKGDIVKKIKLCCADFTFPLLEHDRVLDLIALLGMKGVDIGLFEGRSHLMPSREFVRPEKSGRRLGQAIADRGLKCADLFLQLDNDFSKYAINHPLASRRRKAREAFLKFLDYACGVGTKHVTTLPGVTFEDEARSLSWGRCCEELAWRVAETKKRKLTFGVEGHIGSISARPASIERLVEAVDGLTLTLDYTHFTYAGIADKAAEPLVQYASHFHVRGASKKRLQTSFKDNKIDYKRVVKVMRSTGYRGWLGIEYIWMDWEQCNETDNVSETILFRDYLLALNK